MPDELVLSELLLVVPAEVELDPSSEASSDLRSLVRLASESLVLVPELAEASPGGGPGGGPNIPAMPLAAPAAEVESEVELLLLVPVLPAGETAPSLAGGGGGGGMAPTCEVESLVEDEVEEDELASLDCSDSSRLCRSVESRANSELIPPVDDELLSLLEVEEELAVDE